MLRSNLKIKTSKQVFRILAVTMSIMVFTIPMLRAQKAPTKPLIKLALNAFSFNDTLMSKNSKFTAIDLLDWCAEQNIEALDITGYYLPNYPEVPSDEYLYEFKRKAFQLGIDISGTGIRNNFASPDPKVRAADVARAKQWIIAASKMGAPVLRLFAGEIPKGYENKWDEVAGCMIECYKECAAFGEQHGVIIGIQNHGDMLQTAEQCIKVVKAVNSKWAGIIIDTGNFKVKDPYTDIEAVIPYTVNWQVKESVFGLGSTIPTDMKRFMKILKKSAYRGYIPVETLKIKNVPYNPFVSVPAIMKKIGMARDAEFK